MQNSTRVSLKMHKREGFHLILWYQKGANHKICSFLYGDISINKAVIETDNNTCYNLSIRKI